ncbi:MAG: hypothetical protein BWY83_03225 [bacterium ADurb.Bin478]|nr:MAG: hypothetical protein BWY83_03225 [bacterium ADurb.Bin478]
MTRGAVYWHFDNKPALLAALIDYVHERKKQLVGIWIPDIRTMDDLRLAFVSHARMVAEDVISRRFEFFMSYQMEWSEELLTETHKQLNEIRDNPLDEFKKCFSVPEIAGRLKPDTNLDQLVLTLAAFWVGMCKMFLGRCPGIDFGHSNEAQIELFSSFDLTRTAGAGFDLIMSAVLKKESGDE